MDFDFHAHLMRQIAFSRQTFGPGPRTKGVSDHIRKELLEIEAAPHDLGEWVDVVILGLDGAWRSLWPEDDGAPEEGSDEERELMRQRVAQLIVEAIIRKQTKNEGRKRPDWRTASPDRAIEHVRT